MRIAMATTPQTLDPALAERERVLRILRAEEPRLRLRGSAGLSLFGALARGDAAPRSDVDLVIGTIPRPRLRRSPPHEPTERWVRRLGVLGLEKARGPAPAGARASLSPCYDIKGLPVAVEPIRGRRRRAAAGRG